MEIKCEDKSLRSWFLLSYLQKYSWNLCKLIYEIAKLYQMILYYLANFNLVQQSDFVVAGYGFAFRGLLY